MRGIFNLKPSLPKFNTVWDVQVVLMYLEKQANLTLLDLSAKLCMLFLLGTAQRSQTLYLIELNDIEMHENSCIIRTRHMLKQSRPGYHLDDIMLQPYHNPKLCILNSLQEYLKRTSGLRVPDSKLLISTQKPHNGVSKQTVSRWVKRVMAKAGIKK